MRPVPCILPLSTKPSFRAVVDNVNSAIDQLFSVTIDRTYLYILASGSAGVEGSWLLLSQSYRQRGDGHWYVLSCCMV